MSHRDAPKLDPTALEDWNRPIERLRCEMYCLGRALMPDEETLEKTVGTILLFVVWALIVLGPMFLDAEPPRWELQIGITALAFSILGRMWNLEVERLLNGITISTDGGQPRDDDREE